jgi:hypothetical protein
MWGCGEGEGGASMATARLTLSVAESRRSRHSCAGWFLIRDAYSCAAWLFFKARNRSWGWRTRLYLSFSSGVSHIADGEGALRASRRNAGTGPRYGQDSGTSSRARYPIGTGRGSVICARRGRRRYQRHRGLRPQQTIRHYVEDVARRYRL